MVALVAWSFSLFFHLAAGLRHLAWDLGYGFAIDATYRTGWFVVGAALVLTALAWIAGLVVWGGR